MRLYKKFNIDPPTDDQKTQAKKFAQESVGTSYDYYAKERGQADLNKIVRDIYIGKCTEFSVYNLYAEHGCSVPDTDIYDTYGKSFAGDLTIDSMHIHVKSYYPSLWYTSWVFDPKDPLTTTPSDKDYLALCDLKEDGSGSVYMVKADKCLHLYKDPIAVRLKGKKKCLYLKDLK